MNKTQATLSTELGRALLREIDPRSTLISVRPMGAEGTHPAFVIEARTATGAAWQLAVKCYLSHLGPGNQRAQVVKDWLLKNGGGAQDRVFLLAAKVGGSPAKAAATEEGKEAKPESGKAKASRVDFSLK